MFCLLVVLAKLSLLAKWLARKTPLRKPNRGEGIISNSIKPRPKSAHDFLGLLYCFIVLLCICVVSCPYVIYYPTFVARYSLFVLKVQLNPKQTNKQTKDEKVHDCTCILTLLFLTSLWKHAGVRSSEERLELRLCVPSSCQLSTYVVQSNPVQTKTDLSFTSYLANARSKTAHWCTTLDSYL